MKKLLSCLGICLISLFAGIVLVACSEPASYTIALGQVDENVMIQVESMPEEEILQPNANNVWTVGKNAQIRVKVIATKRGVDMENAVVKVNGQTKTVDTRAYDMFDEEKLTYCFFALPMTQLKSNIEISVTGTAMKKSTFTFNIASDFTSDEQLATKLQETYICTDNSNVYTSLYEILGDEDKKSYIKEFSDGQEGTNSYSTFKMQFKHDDKIINDLYNFSNSNIFMISTPQTSSSARSIYEDGDHLVVNFGQLSGADNYTINVNFGGLSLAQYEFVYPQDQDAYEITIDKTSISYEEGATLTFTKKNSENYDYSQLEIKIGNVTLVANESLEGKTITFTIPENLTPSLAGLNIYTNGQFTISVNGITPIVAE